MFFTPPPPLWPPRAPIANASAILQAIPLAVTLGAAVFLKEPVGWRRWSAVIAGFIGVLVVLRPGFRALGIGHLAALICGLSGAISMIALRMTGVSSP